MSMLSGSGVVEEEAAVDLHMFWLQHKFLSKVSKLVFINILFGKGLIIHLEQVGVVGVEGELLWTHPRPQRWWGGPSPGRGGPGRLPSWGETSRGSQSRTRRRPGGDGENEGGCYRRNILGGSRRNISAQSANSISSSSSNYLLRLSPLPDCPCRCNRQSQEYQTVPWKRKSFFSQKPWNMQFFVIPGV